MNAVLELLKTMPKSIQIAIAGMLLGGIAFAGHEHRYMTVGDYTKSYVLDLKREIRSLRQELARNEIDPEIEQMLRDQLADMLDELCYERPDDPYCE